MKLIKVLGLTLLLILACLCSILQRLLEALVDTYHMSVLDVHENWDSYNKTIDQLGE